MKKILYAALAVAACVVMTACNDNDNESYLAKYNQWRLDNAAWVMQQQQRTNPDGTPYFTTLVPTWDKKAYILIHYFNDRAETEGNLIPLANSTVDMRYIGYLYNDQPVDSSNLMTSHGPGIFRTRPVDVIPGWTIALENMRVGDTAEIVIPYEQAYGITGSAAVNPFSAMRFNLRLVDIVDYEKKP